MHAILSKFAEIYFKNELKSESPFTLDGAKELLRLGILTLAIPTGCAVAASIAEGIINGLMKVKKTAVTDMYFDHAASITLGVMFIVMSTLCRYGAEIKKQNET